MRAEGRGSRRTPLVRTAADIRRSIVTTDGTVHTLSPHEVSTERMAMPSRCRSCRVTFDAGHVVVTARYADCSMWRCPGCGIQHDSRRAWSGAPGEHMGYVDLREQQRAIEERMDEAWGR